MDQSSLISNKIITADNLRSVFAEINNCLAKTQQQFEAEVACNRDLPRNLQSWSMQFFRATLNATITFSDRTKRSYDNYHDFIDDFNHRPGSIKSIFCLPQFNIPIAAITIPPAERRGTTLTLG